MKKTIITLWLLIQTVALTFGQQVVKDLIYFNQGRYELTDQSKKLVDQLLENLNSKEITEIKLSGHTDSDGSDLSNKKLSQDRVTTVRKYLILKGILDDKIKGECFGEEKPIATNENQQGKQQNRRVEIIVKYKEIIENVKSNSIDTAKGEEISPSSAQFVTIKKEVQNFTASPLKGITIKGKRGTVVKFWSNSFIDKNGAPVATDVNIELIEIYTKSDMINHNIQTVSDGKLLESGGMIYLNVTSNNSPVYLKKYSFCQIEFPTKQKQKEMGVFLGDTSSTIMNWKQAPISFFSDGPDPNREILDKYIFHSMQLGWINCDYFIDKPNLTELSVNMADTSGVNFCLVFKKINSVMSAGKKEYGVKFYNVPIGEIATLVAFKKNGNEMLFVSKTITIENNKTETLILEKLTEDEFQAKIKQLD